MRKDKYKTKDQLISELEILRKQIDEFGKSETEHKQTENQLQRSESELAVMNKIAQMFLTIPDEEMYGMVLDIVRDVLDSPYGIFGYISEEGDLVIPSLTHEIWQECKMQGKTIVFPPHTWGDSLWGRAISDRRPYYSNRSFKVPEGHIPVTGFLTVPLIFQGKTVGLISVANRKDGYSDKQRQLLENITNFISPILNARRQRDQQERERMLTEEALRESERKLSEAQKMAQLGNWTWDVKTGNVEWSEEVFKIFQLDPNSFTPQIDSIMALSPWPEDRKRDKELIQRATKSPERGTFEHRFLRPDKSIGYFMSSFQGIYDDNGDLVSIVGTVQDITRRKKMETELRAAKDYLGTVFNNVYDAILIHDLDGRVIDVNDKMLEMYRISREEAIGLNVIRDLSVTDESLEVSRFNWNKIMSGENAFSEWKAKRPKDGSVFDVEVFLIRLVLSDGDYILSNVRDITKRKRADEENDRVNMFLDSIVENIPNMIFVKDAKELRFIRFNRAGEDLLGYSCNELLGKNDYDLFPKEQADFFIEKDRDVLRSGRILDIPEEPLQTKNKGIRFLHTKKVPILNLNGEPDYLLGISEDITERKNAEAEKQRLEEQLARAQKMEALGTLAGGVAHDLNNVLGALVGYSELMKEDLPEDSTSVKYADNILKSSMRATAIIQDLLTMARRGVAVSQVVNLNKLITDHLKTPEFENLQTNHPNVQITTKLENDLFNIKGSPVHLTKTIMNLVSNAVESITGEGKVSIKTKNRYLDQPIQGYDAIQEGDYTVLTVSDTGGGISPKDIDKIFEPFYTKKVMGRSGTGLGLAVVWGTVKDHNGYIDVQSREKKGSTFTLYFPVTREEPAQAEKAVSQLACKGNGESILVVDDVKEQRQLAMSMLKRLGYQVRAVAGGEAAIEYLKTEKSDLVVLDMIMSPGIDGFETYRRIRKINPRQKIIIVSGFSETDRVREMQEMGAGEFVRKPYTMEKIGRAIKKELDRKQA